MSFKDWYIYNYSDKNDNSKLNLTFKELCDMINNYDNDKSINIDQKLVMEKMKELSESLTNILKVNFDINNINEFIKNNKNEL